MNHSGASGSPSPAVAGAQLQLPSSLESGCFISIFPPQCQRIGIRSLSPQHSCPGGGPSVAWSLPRGPETQARRGPSLHTVLLTAPLVCHAQILFRARELDPEPRGHVVRGNHTQSALLAGLGKFVLYELQVLAFTRIGNGVPSSPPILERTKDDGTSTAAPLPISQVCCRHPNPLDGCHF